MENNNQEKFEINQNFLNDHEMNHDDDNKKNNVLLIIAIMIILVLVGIIAFLLMRKPEEKVVENTNEKPTITLKGAPVIELGPGSVYVESGYNAFDKEDGDLTSKVKVEHDINSNKAGIYKVTYSVTDSNNVMTKEVRIVFVRENVKTGLDLKLNGEEVLTIKKNEKYVEPGYTAYEKGDVDITNRVVVEGNVDITVPGEYFLTYSIIDSNKNKVVRTRKIIVLEENGIDVNDNVVRKLHNYLIGSNYEPNFYQNVKVTNANLPQSAALLTAYFQDGEKECISNTTIQNKAKILFNTFPDFISKETKATYELGGWLEYQETYADGIVDSWCMMQIAGIGELSLLGTIASAVKKEDYIYIYDYYYNDGYNNEYVVSEDYCTIDKSQYKCNIYGDSNKKTIVGSSIYELVATSSCEESCIEDNGNYYYVGKLLKSDYKKTKYKHIFKKYPNSENYYWISSEMIK